MILTGVNTAFTRNETSSLNVITGITWQRREDATGELNDKINKPTLSLKRARSHTYPVTMRTMIPAR